MSDLKGDLKSEPGREPVKFDPTTMKPPMADISWVKRKYLDIPYGSLPAQALDIYLPEEGEGPFPLVVHIHGGGFRIGDKRDDHMDAYLGGLHRGLAVASVEYRLSGEATFLAAVLDCREAIRFLKEHASEYSIDPGRIGLIGGSAGGNLTAMLAMNVPNGEFPGEGEKASAAADGRDASAASAPGADGGRDAPAASAPGTDGKAESSAAIRSEEPFVRTAVCQFGPMNFGTMEAQARANGISETHESSADMPESAYLGVPIADAPQELIAAANPATYASPALCCDDAVLQIVLFCRAKKHLLKHFLKHSRGSGSILGPAPGSGASKTQR